MKHRLTFRQGLIALLILSLCLPLTGCGEILQELFGESREERENRICAETVEAVFAALDAEDADALYGLFSEEAQSGDPELAADIADLMEVYEGPYVTNGFDGFVGCDASFEPEGRTYAVRTTIPVEAGDTYYWVFLRYTYECEPDPTRIGITELRFYTADEKSLSLYDEENRLEDSLGLAVYAERTLDCEWRCIYGNPIPYTPRETVDADEVLRHLKQTDRFSSFIERFGEPAGGWVYYYYPLPDENGEARWLCISVSENEDQIVGGSVVDRFRWIRELP